jgi:hypothetical protein
VDTLPKGVSHDLDLDALMIRVREAAMTGGTGRVTAPPLTAGDQIGPDLDLARLIDGQGEWNEQTIKSLAAVVECLRNLRDDWVAAHTRICQELERLSALLEQMHLSREKNARHKATPRRAPVPPSREATADKRRRRPSKANGHRS